MQFYMEASISLLIFLLMGSIFIGIISDSMWTVEEIFQNEERFLSAQRRADFAKKFPEVLKSANATFLEDWEDCGFMVKRVSFLNGSPVILGVRE